LRLDHLAYRVKDRIKTASFFCSTLHYKVGDEFTIDFDDGSQAKCVALVPPEKPPANHPVPWQTLDLEVYGSDDEFKEYVDYHMAPEIFVSDGSPESIVGQWVAERNGVGGIHHLAYQVDSVEDTMRDWKNKGYAEFTTDKPLTCPGLVQCFTQPSELTGVIYEFIERGEDSKGFCRANVKQLMESTRNDN